MLVNRLSEFHENAVRKDFSVSEVVAIKRALEPELKQQGKRNDLTSEESAEVPKRKESRDIIAEYTGFSHDILSKTETKDAIDVVSI